MDFIKIAAIIFITVVIISTLPAIEKPVTSLITVSACVIVMLMVIGQISDVTESIQNAVGIKHPENFSLLFKVMGISMITQFISDISLDSGNKTLANQMILIGKAAIVFTGLPVYIQVLEIIGNLLG